MSLRRIVLVVVTLTGITVFGTNRQVNAETPEVHQGPYMARMISRPGSAVVRAIARSVDPEPAPFGSCYRQTQADISLEIQEVLFGDINPSDRVHVLSSNVIYLHDEGGARIAGMGSANRYVFPGDELIVAMHPLVPIGCEFDDEFAGYYRTGMQWFVRRSPEGEMTLFSRCIPIRETIPKEPSSQEAIFALVKRQFRPEPPIAFGDWKASFDSAVAHHSKEDIEVRNRDELPRRN